VAAPHSLPQPQQSIPRPFQLVEPYPSFASKVSPHSWHSKADHTSGVSSYVSTDAPSCLRAAISTWSRMYQCCRNRPCSMYHRISATLVAIQARGARVPSNMTSLVKTTYSTSGW
jgi:hypothetical protein